MGLRGRRRVSADHDQALFLHAFGARDRVQNPLGPVFFEGVCITTGVAGETECRSCDSFRRDGRRSR